jgi:diphthine synthase
MEAAETDIAMLVVGDPFGATTHSDLMIRARYGEMIHKI